MWSGIPISKNFPQFVVIHTVKGFSIVNEAEVDIFLEFPCFLCDSTNVGNLISGSSAFSKHPLYLKIHGSGIAESTCNVEDLGSISGLGRSPGEGRLLTSVFWPGEFHRLSPWGRKELGHD